MEPKINFCSCCGAAINRRIPPGDSLERHVCDSCGTIHYQNPRMVVGALPVWEDKILLCRRAIEPSYGKWTLPGGFMENGESLEQAASRETLEESGAQIELTGLYSIISLPHIHQVHFFYRARLLNLDLHPGEETLEQALFSEADIPWGDIAFRTVELTLRHYFRERASGSFGFHSTSLYPPLREG